MGGVRGLCTSLPGYFRVIYLVWRYSITYGMGAWEKAVLEKLTMALLASTMGMVPQLEQKMLTSGLHC